jgi:hypothetical protein
MVQLRFPMYKFMIKQLTIRNEGAVNYREMQIIWIFQKKNRKIMIRDEKEGLPTQSLEHK